MADVSPSSTSAIIAASPDPDAATAAPRLVVEEWSPRVDGGDYPVRRLVGETVTIEATVFTDGHEQLAVDLLWRAVDERDWRRVRMAALPTDRWQAEIVLERLGRHEYAVEGWLDIYGGFRRDFRKKLDADVAQSVDYREGRGFVAAAAAQADKALRQPLER